LAPLLLNPYLLIITVGVYLHQLAFLALGGLACGIYL
jgi:hypothetical protein